MARANGDARGGAPAQERELRARGKRTMRKLLDAGIEVFSKRGFHAARVDDIVKTAKMSHGTFYLYFSNKDDLFRALALEVADEITSLAGELEPLSPDAEGEANLRDWLERFSDVYDRFGPVIGAWTEAETADDEAGRIGTDVLGSFASALGAQIAASNVDDLDPNVAGMALVAMVERFHYYALSGLVASDRHDVLDTLAAVTHAGLFGTQPAQRAQARP